MWYNVGEKWFVLCEIYKILADFGNCRIVGYYNNKKGGE